MANVEIYLEGVDLEAIVGWVKAKLSASYIQMEDDDMILLEGEFDDCVVPVVVQKNVEGDTLTGVWFNAETTPWCSDADCAREAFSYFGWAVQCDPGPEYPEDNQFLRISDDGETLIEILGESSE